MAGGRLGSPSSGSRWGATGHGWEAGGRAQLGSCERLWASGTERRPDRPTNHTTAWIGGLSRGLGRRDV
eukprot:15446974-Alexandrium_andersonii.AAC.1